MIKNSLHLTGLSSFKNPQPTPPHRDKPPRPSAQNKKASAKKSPKKLKSEFKAYGVAYRPGMTTDLMLLDLIRQVMAVKYERTWLAGKPVGAA
jgi:hypothetical protein